MAAGRNKFPYHNFYYIHPVSNCCWCCCCNFAYAKTSSWSYWKPLIRNSLSVSLTIFLNFLSSISAIYAPFSGCAFGFAGFSVIILFAIRNLRHAHIKMNMGFSPHRPSSQTAFGWIHCYANRNKCDENETIAGNVDLQLLPSYDMFKHWYRTFFVWFSRKGRIATDDNLLVNHCMSHGISQMLMYYSQYSSIRTRSLIIIIIRIVTIFAVSCLGELSAPGGDGFLMISWRHDSWDERMHCTSNNDDCGQAIQRASSSPFTTAIIAEPQAQELSLSEIVILWLGFRYALRTWLNLPMPNQNQSINKKIHWNY